ncbi:hypothetical protein BJF82_05245 [Kytococcus sp. CUA-901]|nr:hypothetical protein BJF82_05245 [Kytococcus sp. CUA-901]
MAIACDWRLTWAPMRAPQGRCRKYSSTWSRGSSSATPRKRRARNMLGQVQVTATRGSAAICSALAETKEVNRRRPCGAMSRHRTVRTSGAPSASTVARAMAAGSGTSPRSRARWWAADTHSSMTDHGAGGRLSGSRPSPVYSRRSRRRPRRRASSEGCMAHTIASTGRPGAGPAGSSRPDPALVRTSRARDTGAQELNPQP